MADPDNGSYGIRVNTDSSHDDHDDIQKVELALSGAKTEGKTEWEPPYSLYGDSGEENLTGEALPAGSYDLKSTAYDTNGDVLGTLTVSFTVAAQEQTAVPNNDPTGAPAITGNPRVGKTLTANTSQIDDFDGLDNAEYIYQWIRNDGNGDTNIAGATDSTYTLLAEDEGKTLKVRVTFTDDADTQESLTSAPTSLIKAEDAVTTPNGKTVYFTFDDGPHPVYTPQILDVLASYDALAMFFVTGINVDKHPDIIERIAADGHGIGNHTWSHERLPDLTEDEFTETITRTQDAIGETASPCLRPPYGAITSAGRRLAESLGFQVVMWTLPNPAWDGTWVDSFVSHIVPNLRDGSIVLMHDGDGHGKAVLALNKILEQGTNEGYRFEPVCQPPGLGEEDTPTISGTARVGETLTADTSGIDDDDGLDTAAFTYQWVRSDGGTDTEIAGANGSSYTLVEADVGRTIKVTGVLHRRGGQPRDA